jgi:hypothetical protein
MPAKSLADMDIQGYDVSWNAADLGWVEDVDPTGLKIITVEQKIKALGGIKVDGVIVGLEGTIKLKLLQPKAASMRQVWPGAAPTGPVPLMPGTGSTRQYALAQKLIIHPRHLPADDKSEDIILLKAFPLTKLPKGDGEEWRSIDLEFEPFPDQALLQATTPSVVYGYYGGEPV